jgi:hypothetical protein
MLNYMKIQACLNLKEIRATKSVSLRGYTDGRRKRPIIATAVQAGFLAEGREILAGTYPHMRMGCMSIEPNGRDKKNAGPNNGRGVEWFRTVVVIIRRLGWTSNT